MCFLSSSILPSAVSLDLAPDLPLLHPNRRWLATQAVPAVLPLLQSKRWSSWPSGIQTPGSDEAAPGPSPTSASHSGTELLLLLLVGAAAWPGEMALGTAAVALQPRRRQHQGGCSSCPRMVP